MNLASGSEADFITKTRMVSQNTTHMELEEGDKDLEGKRTPPYAPIQSYPLPTNTLKRSTEILVVSESVDQCRWSNVS